MGALRLSWVLLAGAILAQDPPSRDGWMSIYDAPEPWGPWTPVRRRFSPVPQP